MVNMRQASWSPDTCDCTLIYEWDNDLPDAQKVLSFVAAEKICEYHKARGLSGVNLWNALYTSDGRGENQRKNLFFGYLKQIRADADYEKFNGRATKWWGFNDAGVLIVTIPPSFTLASNHKTQIQTFCDNKFGAGRVIIQ